MGIFSNVLKKTLLIIAQTKVVYLIIRKIYEIVLNVMSSQQMLYFCQGTVHISEGEKKKLISLYVN